MVKYINWPDKWNEWIDRASDRLRPLGTSLNASDGARDDGARGETHDDLCAVCEEVRSRRYRPEIGRRSRDPCRPIAPPLCARRRAHLFAATALAAARSTYDASPRTTGPSPPPRT